MPFDPIEKVGGSSRFITLLTIIIHFVHPLLCISNYLDWVRFQGTNIKIGNELVVAYLTMTIISFLFFLLISSVFYMWAWRYPEPEEIAKRRRIYGIIGNLIISDFPIFMVEVQFVWAVRFETALQGICFIFTCISFLYSGFRVWTFIIVKVIKHKAPVTGAQINNNNNNNYLNNNYLNNNNNNNISAGSSYYVENDVNNNRYRGNNNYNNNNNNNINPYLYSPGGGSQRYSRSNSNGNDNDYELRAGGIVAE